MGERRLNERAVLLFQIENELDAAREYYKDARTATNDEDYHASVHALWWANNRITQLLNNLTELV